MCVETGANQYLLKHTSDETMQQIPVTMIHENEGVRFEGLPETIQRQLMAFNQEEIQQYPTTCLNVILKQTYNPKE